MMSVMNDISIGQIKISVLRLTGLKILGRIGIYIYIYIYIYSIYSIYIYIYI